MVEPTLLQNRSKILNCCTLGCDDNHVGVILRAKVGESTVVDYCKMFGRKLGGACSLTR